MEPQSQFRERNSPANSAQPLPADLGMSGASLRTEPASGSLAEMAQRDLDAALQLLANRAQYITGASGAAIALRREGRNDMLCRATTGSNAPELGALFSTELGLSGESVRTRQALRCDDAERDARVNRDVCRQMGIASVVVMPVVNDDEVLGVFELFSGKANAFGERDVSAVQRLSAMVETAVRLAQATQALPERLKRDAISADARRASATSHDAEPDAEEDQILESELAVGSSSLENLKPVASAAVIPVPSQNARRDEVLDKTSAPDAANDDPKKKLFWSAALHPASEAEKGEADQSHVPPVLRGLRKCEACGFPVSAGRSLCVECEEKKWRGQLGAPKAAVAPATPSVVAPVATPSKPQPQAFAAAAQLASASAALPQSGRAAAAVASPGLTVSPAVQGTPLEKESRETAALDPASRAAPRQAEPAAISAPSVAPEFVLSAGMEPAQSWLSRNKYMVGVLLAVAVAVASIFLLR